ncbi:MAG: hypothetical protein PVG99_05510 [Desulfobacteraceae bacterium]|jgi:hypothetical protein
MISPETERVLLSLEKIETALSGIYQGLPKKEDFTGPVKNFWAEIMNEKII